MIINHQPQGIVFLLRRDDRLFVGSKDLRRWRLRLPDTTPLNLDGEDFYAFDALEGLLYKFEDSTQTLTIEASPSLFDATLLKGTDTKFSFPSWRFLVAFLITMCMPSMREVKLRLMVCWSWVGLAAGVRSKPVFWRRTWASKLGPSGWIPLGRAISRCKWPACDLVTRSAARAVGGGQYASAVCSGRAIF